MLVALVELDFEEWCPIHGGAKMVLTSLRIPTSS
jgi:hypothetical protein